MTARIFTPLLLLVLLATHGGCAAPAMIATAGVAAAQSSTAAYSNGELRAARLVTLDEAYEATRAVFDELELEVITETSRDRQRFIAAREPGGPRFRVRVERKSEVVTKIRIRIGLIGDLAVSRLTLRQIDRHLESAILARLAAMDGHESRDAFGDEDETD